MSLESFAIVLGVISYLFGFPLIFAESAAVAWRKKFLKDDVTLRVVGGAIVVIAAVTLKSQWEITPDAAGIVVLLAWVALLKGLFITWWPGNYANFMTWEERTFKAPVWQMLHGLIMVVVGASLTYLGLVLQTL